jgi:hypothetical protein
MRKLGFSKSKTGELLGKGTFVIRREIEDNIDQINGK